jgi:nitrite reductase/ring-hydroxylating ferredoxin subunit
MDGFLEIAAVGDLPIGKAKACVVADRTIALYHTADGFFATDNTCPHRGGPLAEGDLMGNEIVCPWHLWGFDVASGVCTGNPDVRIAAHEVRIAGDRVMVRLP